MSVCLVFNALGANEYLREPVEACDSGFRFLLDRFARAARRGTFAPDFILICGMEVDREFLMDTVAAAGLAARFCPVADTEASTLMEAASAFVEEEDIMVWTRADAILASPDLAAVLLQDHSTYRAEFTFAEGYPAGYAVQILDAFVISVVKDLAAQYSLPATDPALIFAIIKKDINNFAIETRLANEDHRMLRIDFHANSLRGLLVCRNYAAQANLEPDAFEKHVLQNQEGLRTLPAFMNVQIIETCPQVCSWCPHALRKGQAVLEPGQLMSVERFFDLCSRFQNFAPDSTVSISLWGEPSLHPGIYEIIDGFSRFPRLSLLVETSGIGWNLQELRKIAAKNPPWLKWVVSLDAMTPEMYAKVRGEGFQEAFESAGDFVDLFPQSAWIQAVRATTSEQDLFAFVKHWKAKKAQFIIQKYDHFSLSLPDLRVSDISPLDRVPCWHLKRDLHVLVDGRATRCREDLEARDGLGNVFNDDLASIWAAMDGLYRTQLGKVYPDICGDCDESYTFNF